MTEVLRVDEVEDYTNKLEPETHLLTLELLSVSPALNERVLKGIEGIEGLTSLPMQLIEKYADIAVRHAILKRYPDGWVATILGFPGVWAKERSKEQAREVLKEVVLDWALLKIEHQDRDLPVIEEINLNVL